MISPMQCSLRTLGDSCVLILELKASGSSRIILKRSLNPDIATTSTRIPETVIVVQPNESHLAHADLNKLELCWKLGDGVKKAA